MGKAERLATAVSDDDLGWSELSTKPVEYVAALSAATGLGSDIFRAKDYDRFALRRAMLLLTKKAIDAGKRSKLPLSEAMAQAMAVSALLERLHPQCRTCHGSAVIVTAELKVVCPICEGIGVHRYTDKERARLCGIKPDDWHKWQSRYRLVIGIVHAHDVAVWAASERLG